MREFIFREQETTIPVKGKRLVICAELVRCKDCKYAYLTDDGECKYCEMEKDDNGFLIERYRSWDWFCADGERR